MWASKISIVSPESGAVLHSVELEQNQGIHSICLTKFQSVGMIDWYLLAGTSNSMILNPRHSQGKLKIAIFLLQGVIGNTAPRWSDRDSLSVTLHFRWFDSCLQNPCWWTIRIFAHNLFGRCSNSNYRFPGPCSNWSRASSTNLRFRKKENVEKMWK